MDGEPSTASTPAQSPPFTLRSLLDEPPMSGRGEKKTSKNDTVITLCCGRAFLNEVALQKHYATDCHREGRLDDNKGGDKGEECGVQEKDGRNNGNIVVNGAPPLPTSDRLIKKKFSTLSQSNRPRIINKEAAGLGRSLNEDDDNSGEAGSLPSQKQSASNSYPPSTRCQHRCSYCKASYACQDLLAKHVSIWHAGKPLPDLAVASGPLPESANESTDKTEASGQEHREEEEKGTSNDNHSFEGSESDDVGSEGSDEVPCPVKGCVFKSSLAVPGSLHTHMTVAHCSNGQYKCALCPCAYRFATGLKKHMEYVHRFFSRSAQQANSVPPSTSTPMPLVSTSVHKTRGRKRNVKKVKCPKCEYVGRTFHVKRHMRTAHSSEVSFSCPDCTCVFDSERKLAMHQASHTRQEKATTGTLSEPKVSGDRADGTFACTKPLCTYQTLWKNMMDDHIATCHVEGGLNCQFCSCSFSTKMKRMLHVASAHPNEEATASANVCNVQNPGVTVYKNNFRCSQCSFASSDSNEFQSHLQVCASLTHKVRSESAPSPSAEGSQQAPPSSSPSKKSPKKVRNRLYTSRCPICGSGHEGLRHLTEHMERCHVEAGVKCPECSCTFKSLSSMTTHKNIAHNRKGQQQRPHVFIAKKSVGGAVRTSNKCPKCPHTAASSGHLAEHLKRAHYAGGLQCPSCPCTFATSVGLKKHTTEIHSEADERNSQENGQQEEQSTQSTLGRKVKKKIISSICQICGFQTTSKDIKAGLNDHRRTSHVEGGRPCKNCPCSFASKLSLRRHNLLVHSWGENPITRNVKRSKVIVKKAKASSTSAAFINKPSVMSCPECPYSTTLRMSFLRHVNKAHVTNGIHCPSCPCRFKSKRALKGHIPHCLGKDDKRNDPTQGDENSETPQQHPASPISETTCPFCSCDCQTASVLADHINEVHPPQENSSNSPPLTVKLGGGVLRCQSAGCSFLTLLPASMEKHAAVCPPTQQEVEKDDSPRANAHLPQAHANSMTPTKKPTQEHFTTDREHDAEDESEMRPVGTRRSSTRLLGRKSQFEVDENQQEINEEEVSIKKARQQTEVAPGASQEDTLNSSSEKDENLEKCPLCDYVSTKKSALSSHVETCHVEGGVKCKFCSVTTKTRRGIITHMSNVHKALKAESMIATKARTADVAASNTSVSLQQTFHENDENTQIPGEKPVFEEKDAFCCSICEWIGKEQSDVVRHEQKCHVKESREKDKLNKRSYLTTTTVHECRKCSFSFATQFALAVHMELAKDNTKKVHFQRRTHSLTTDGVIMKEKEIKTNADASKASGESVQDKEVARELEEMAESWKSDETAKKSTSEKQDESPTAVNKLIGKVKAAAHTQVRKVSPAKRPIRCAHCKVIFYGPAALEAHVSSAHNNTCSGATTVDESSSPTPVPIVKCGVCPLFFRTHIELTHHYNGSHNSYETIPPFKSTIASIPENDKRDEEARYTKETRSIESQQEEGPKRKRGRPRKIPVDEAIPPPTVPPPRPSSTTLNSGRGRPLGSSWLFNLHRKIDDNWRLAEATSKASTLWTIDKLDCGNGADEEESDDAESTSSSASSERSVDVTKNMKRRLKNDTSSNDVKVKQRKLADFNSKEDQKSDKQERRIQLDNAQSGTPSTNSASNQCQVSQSFRVQKKLGGRPVRKSAENAATLISRVLADENDILSGRQQLPWESTETASRRSTIENENSRESKEKHQASRKSREEQLQLSEPANESPEKKQSFNLGESSTTDDVVEIPNGNVGISEVDSTTSSSRRRDWLKEFMRYMCSRCSRSFDTSNLLAKHFQVCSDSCQLFRCVLCEESSNPFLTLTKLKDHIWSIHRPSDFVDSTLSAYSCSLCKQELKDRKAFILHTSIPHLFRCKKCSFISRTRMEMDEHKKIKHCNTNVPENTPLRRRTTSVASQNENPPVSGAMQKNWRCPCRAKFARTVDFKDHIKKCEHFKDDQEPCQKQLTPGKDASVKETTLVPLKPVVVDVETNVVLDAANVNTVETALNDVFPIDKPDQETAEESDSLVCDQCAYVATSISDARDHANEVASNESRICDMCGYVASSNCDLLLHQNAQCAPSEITAPESNCDTPQNNQNDANVSNESVPFEYVQAISLNSDELMMSLEGLGEQPIILFELEEVAEATKDELSRISN